MGGLAGGAFPPRRPLTPQPLSPIPPPTLPGREGLCRGAPVWAPCFRSRQVQGGHAGPPLRQPPGAGLPLLPGRVGGRLGEEGRGDEGQRTGSADTPEILCTIFANPHPLIGRR